MHYKVHCGTWPKELRERTLNRLVAALRRKRAFLGAAPPWYTSALGIVVLLWVVFTWPHFRPAFTPEALGKMLVLALFANLCYCAAYPADWLIQTVSSDTARRRFRCALWILGMLLALLIENYWIADEIYPDIQAGRVLECQGADRCFLEE